MEHYILKFGDTTSCKPIGDDDWINKIEEDYNNCAQCIIHNISPPGAGKTYLWNKILKIEARYLDACAETLTKIISKECHAVRVDCSNDELVERSRASILSERFPIEGKPSLLIADEFRTYKLR